MYPIHWAILLFIHRSSCSLSDALSIVRALLKERADPSAHIIKNVSICSVNSNSSYSWKYIPKEGMDTRTFLRYVDANLYGRSRSDFLDGKELIQKSFKVPPCYQIRSSYRDNVIATMEALLLSPSLSDVYFVCPDGSVLYAHRNILAAKSPYFGTSFTGAWRESHSDGKWVTSNSSAVMEAILRYIYVGEIVRDVLLGKTTELFYVAGEYQMEDLREICVQVLAHDLSAETIKDTLLLAYLHEVTPLKEACVKYIQGNALELGAANILGDLKEDERSAKIWQDLVDGMKEHGIEFNTEKLVLMEADEGD